MDPSPIASRTRDVANAFGGLVADCKTLRDDSAALYVHQGVAFLGFDRLDQAIKNSACELSLAQTRIENINAIIKQTCIDDLDKIQREIGASIRSLRLLLEKSRAYADSCQKLVFLKSKTRQYVKQQSLGQRKVKRQRCQLDWATAKLRIILAALDLAHALAPGAAIAACPSNEDCLFAEELRARNDLKRVQQRADSDAISTGWLQELTMDAHIRLHTLARLWTQSLPEEIRGNYAQDERLRRYIETSRRELVAETREPLRRLQAEGREQREQHRARVEAMQDEYQQLEDESRERQERDAENISELSREVRTQENRVNRAEADRDRIQARADHRATEDAQRYTLLERDYAGVQNRLDTEVQATEDLRHTSRLQENRLDDERRAKDRLQHDKDFMETQLRSERETSSTLRREKGLQADELNEVRRATDRIQQERDRKDTELRSERATNNTLRQERERTENKLHSERLKNDTLQNSNDIQRRELEVQSSENERHQREITSLRSQLENQDGRITNFRNQLAEADLKIRQWESKHAARGVQLRSERQTAERLRDEIDRTKSEIANLQKAIQTQRNELVAERETTERLRQQVDRHGSNATRLKEMVTKARNQRNILQTKVSDLSGQLQSLKDEVQRLTSGGNGRNGGGPTPSLYGPSLPSRNSSRRRDPYNGKKARRGHDDDDDSGYDSNGW